MIITLDNGWRDESSEGPYTEVLQTKYDWKRRIQWSVIKGVAAFLYTAKSSDGKV